jgi:hypothetical protein
LVQVEEEEASGKDMGVTSWLANGLSIEVAQYMYNTSFGNYSSTINHLQDNA